MQPIPSDVIAYARGLATYNGKFSPEKYAELLASPMPRRTGRHSDGSGDPDYYEAYAKASAQYWASPEQRLLFQVICRQMAPREDGTCSAYLSRGRVAAATGMSFAPLSSQFAQLTKPAHGVPLLLCHACQGPNREHVFELVHSPAACAAATKAARATTLTVATSRPKVARMATMAATAATTGDAAFERFWSVYPNPTGAGRGSALEAWRSIGQHGPDESFATRIIAAAQAYANDPKVQHNIRENHPEFITAPANWLKRGKWDDAPTHAAKPRVCRGRHAPPCPDDVVCSRKRAAERDRPAVAGPVAVGAA